VVVPHHPDTRTPGHPDIQISRYPLALPPIVTTSGVHVTLAATHPGVARSATATGRTTGTTRPTPPTTAPGSVITITGGPNATANIPGPQNDAADFYGILVALAIIVVAIAITRVAFGRRRGTTPASEPRPPRPS
jgi:hypothetical protein